MNTEPNQTETPTTTDVISATTNRRRRGHVARLPKPIRDKINLMLDDGVPYTEIAAEIQKTSNPPLSIALTDDHIASWKAGGFQDWLKEREKAEQFADEIERVEDLLAATNADEVPDLLLKLAAARLCGYVKDLAPDQLRSTTDDDPANLIRLLNLLPKFSREALRTRKYRRSVKKEDDAQLKQLDPNREFNEDEHLAIVDRVNRLFGLRQYRKPSMDAFNGTPLAPRQAPSVNKGPSESTTVK